MALGRDALNQAYFEGRGPPSGRLSGMTMLEFLRHSVPFQTQPSGQTAGGPGSTVGQVSLSLVWLDDSLPLGVSPCGVAEPQA